MSSVPPPSGMPPPLPPFPTDADPFKNLEMPPDGPTIRAYDPLRDTPPAPNPFPLDGPLQDAPTREEMDQMEGRDAFPPIPPAPIEMPLGESSDPPPDAFTDDRAPASVAASDATTDSTTDDGVDAGDAGGGETSDGSGDSGGDDS